ncbi:MAG: DUF6514 family protein [Clostridiales bacterium]|nr:DUF6514 family protein [Clostridiales bacterium]
MYLYILSKENLHNSYIGNYISYGIECIEIKAGQAKQAAFISDVSVNFCFAADLALKCTLGQLSPCHLADVVEDEI